MCRELKAPPASFGWFASIKPFGPAARIRFGFASTVAIKVGAFSTIKCSSMATARVLRFLFFFLRTFSKTAIANAAVSGS